MLYTKAGDDGSTKLFACDQRLSKSTAIAEALGTVDEINSLLGLCKVKASDLGLKITSLNEDVGQILEQVQQGLFIVQAELAGAPKSMSEEKVVWLEKITDSIEKELPPIKTFFVSGGTELAALFDFARTIARRAERRVVGVAEEKPDSLQPATLAFMNRLSSILYALARYSNFQAGVSEPTPTYK